MRYIGPEGRERLSPQCGLGMDRSCHMVGVRSGYFSSIGGSPDDSIRG